MSTSAADYLVDRRRLRRQLGFWRIVAFLAAALAVIAVGVRLSGPAGLTGPHIARLSVTGFIAGNEQTLKLIRAGRATSPPSRRRWCESTAPAAAPKVRRKFTTNCADWRRRSRSSRWSAAWPPPAPISPRSAADRIFVRGNSIVGSIGVLVEYPNVSGLMDKVGVKLEVDQIVAVEGGAERLRADQRGSARRHGVADRQLLRLVQGAGEGPARP